MNVLSCRTIHAFRTMTAGCATTAAPARPILRVVALLPALLLGACGTNPFLENYGGERMAPVLEATVVSEPPPVDTVRQLGGCSFQSSNGQTGDKQAKAAAQQIGADFVMWSRQTIDRQQWSENDPVYERRESGRGQFSSYIPLPGSRERWTYTATFWRSLSLPAAATSVPAAGAATPASAPAGASASAPAPAPK
jgi:hypothetical protein